MICAEKALSAFESNSDTFSFWCTTFWSQPYSGVLPFTLGSPLLLCQKTSKTSKKHCQVSKWKSSTWGKESCAPLWHTVAAFGELMLACLSCLHPPFCSISNTSATNETKVILMLLSCTHMFRKGNNGAWPVLQGGRDLWGGFYQSLSWLPLS